MTNHFHTKIFQESYETLGLVGLEFKSVKGADRIPTHRAKMGLRPEFLSEPKLASSALLSAYNWGLKGREG